jgi:hypothetical protein
MEPDLAAMVLASLGVTIEDLQRAGADAYDLEHLHFGNRRSPHLISLCVDSAPCLRRKRPTAFDSSPVTPQAACRNRVDGIPQSAHEGTGIT